MKKPIILLTVIVAASCSPKLVMPDEQDAARGSAKYPGLTLAELQEGKSIYEQNCGSCHALKRPKSESEEEWKKITPLMVHKTNQKAGKVVIDERKQETLLRYLLTMRTR